ncbi:MAG: undecaprenyl-diphosphate phosphatase [Halomonadaceae bacterium]|nr:MAG: undecaprenyl-diphosphate phosphatase [Halomonadaceae bacterium]
MSLWSAVLLGFVQGLFMFLPVSSTAHMTLTQHWLNNSGAEVLPPDHPEMIFVYLVAHLGTLVSIAVVFWSSLSVFTLNVLRSVTGPSKVREGLWWKLFWLGMFSVLITGLVGLSLRAFAEDIFARTGTIAITLTITGILLYWSDKLPRRTERLRDIGWKTAGFIGLAQAIAFAPGISRSAMTMTAGLFTGLKRRWVAQYSFFLAIPTICAISLVYGIELYRAGQWLDQIGLTALIVVFVVSALVGIVALKLVITLLYKAQLKVFAFYVWALAAALLLFW